VGVSEVGEPVVELLAGVLQRRDDGLVGGDTVDGLVQPSPRPSGR